MNTLIYILRNEQKNYEGPVKVGPEVKLSNDSVIRLRSNSRIGSGVK